MSIFNQGTETYRSDIVLGEKYRDPETGIEGKAVAIYFFEHACERVSIRYAHDGDLKEATFDAPELENVETKIRPAQQATGGPDRGGARVTPSRR